MESPEHTAQLEIDLTRSARAGLQLIREKEVMNDELREQRKQYTAKNRGIVCQACQDACQSSLCRI